MGPYDDNPSGRHSSRRRWDDHHDEHSYDENGYGDDNGGYAQDGPQHGGPQRGGPQRGDPRHGEPPPAYRDGAGRTPVGRAQVPGPADRGSRQRPGPGSDQPPARTGRWQVNRAAMRAIRPDEPASSPDTTYGRHTTGGHGDGAGGNSGGGKVGGNSGGGNSGGGGIGGGGLFGDEPTNSGRHIGGRLPGRLAINPAWLRRRRTLVAAFAVLIMLIGTGVVATTYFVDGVKTSSELTFPSTTTIFYRDGSQLAKLGEVTRYELKFAEFNDPVVKSIVASEDQTFWTNEGVDLGGVMRAAWNNFTGGDTQGASTITQQYARLAFDLEGVTYQRKAREAVLAWKISDDLTKEQILESYLNAVPFGRQTYGIEAAAQAFFGKTAKRSAPPDQQITWAEAMVLVAMVKQPNPNPDDPKGQPGYDPTFSPEAEANARSRWEYVRTQLVEMKDLTQEQADKLVFPKDQVHPYNPNTGNGLEAPGGMVVNHVLSELTHTAGSPFNGARDWKAIREGGYQIYTTLDRSAQSAAEHAADGAMADSPMAGQPANLQSALVAVEPGTGRVIAYYGGHDGKGADYGGFYYDENNVATGVGRFPPGSSFKVYTLAAALKAGMSLKSYWDWNPHDMPGRTGSARIRNASTCGSQPAGDPTPCSLLQSTISSLNVPFYAVTVSVSPAKVLQMARDAGIDYMWTDSRERRDLRTVQDMGTEVPSKFDTILGIGQYPITVMDHANGLATFAAGGLRSQVHFVSRVVKADAIVYGETLPRPDRPRVFSPENSNDLTYALSQVGSAKVSIGWDTAGKTGTWEYTQASNENAHAWMVGYSKRLATAVWVGNKSDEQALKDKNKKTIYGSGLPADIWKKFMTAATKALNEKKVNTKFNPPSYAGNEMPPGAVPGPDQRQGGPGGWFNWPTRGPRNNR